MFNFGPEQMLICKSSLAATKHRAPRLFQAKGYQQPTRSAGLSRMSNAIDIVTKISALRLTIGPKNCSLDRHVAQIIRKLICMQMA